MCDRPQERGRGTLLCVRCRAPRAGEFPSSLLGRVELVTVLRDPARERRDGSLECMAAGAERHVSTREKHLLPLLGRSNEIHDGRNGGERNDVVLLSYSVEDVPGSLVQLDRTPAQLPAACH